MPGRHTTDPITRLLGRALQSNRLLDASRFSNHACEKLSADQASRLVRMIVKLLFARSPQAMKDCTRPDSAPLSLEKAPHLPPQTACAQLLRAGYAQRRVRHRARPEGRRRRPRCPGNQGALNARSRTSPGSSPSGNRRLSLTIHIVPANQRPSRSLNPLCGSAGARAIQNPARVVKKLWRTKLLCGKRWKTWVFVDCRSPKAYGIKCGATMLMNSREVITLVFFQNLGKCRKLPVIR